MILSQRYDKKIVQSEFERKTFLEDYDVIVVGLGTAGSIAAITAAKKGLKVLGIEKLNSMGGTGTNGGVVGYYFGSKGGAYESIDFKAQEMIKDSYLPYNGVHAQLKEYVLEQEALEYGAHLCYQSTLVGVYLEGKTARGLMWIGPNGIKEAGSKILIDCTGDAEVCALADCETRMGREMDGQVQPFSNVLFSLEKDTVICSYTDCGYTDPTDATNLSNAMVLSSIIPSHLKEVYDDTSQLLYIAPQLGIRESRYIVGEDNITLDDRLHDKVTDRPVFYTYSNADNHSKDMAFEKEIQQDWMVASGLWGINLSIPVPLGALIPKGFSGILAAGRCIAADHEIAACTRMKRDAQKCGEAAATAAYLSIKTNLDLRNIDYFELVSLLKETGCYDEQNNVNMKDTLFKDDSKNLCFDWMTTPEAIKKSLCSERPGIGIWSSKRLGNEFVVHLREWIKEDHEHLRKNSAFALALMGDINSAPILRQMVMDRDAFIPKTSRKFNQVRGYSAIYLLGKLKDTEVVPELIRILNTPNEFNQFKSEEKEFIVDAQDLYFQYFSHALMALIKIADCHSNMKTHISNALRALLDNPDLDLWVNLKGNLPLKYSMNHRVRFIINKSLNQW